jgi:hypothetical protein
MAAAISLREDFFEAVRDAALAIKALRRWDIVVDRSLEARDFVARNHGELAKLLPVAAEDDDFPFRWLFPKDVASSFTVQQKNLLAKSRWLLFKEFRSFLCLPDDRREMSSKEAKVFDRTKYLAVKWLSRIRETVAFFSIRKGTPFRGRRRRRC